MNIRLSPLAIAAAQVMRGQGKTLGAIARHLGVHVDTVRAALAGRTHKAWADQVAQHIKRGET